jgi:hypothetical protein
LCLFIVLFGFWFCLGLGLGFVFVILSLYCLSCLISYFHVVLYCLLVLSLLVLPCHIDLSARKDTYYDGSGLKRDRLGSTRTSALFPLSEVLSSLVLSCLV